MEYLDFGPLTDLILHANLEEGHISAIAKEVIHGIDYLHKNKIIHRDIKSDNILVGKNCNIKLGDFGYCASITSLNDLRTTSKLFSIQFFSSKFLFVEITIVRF